MKLDPTYLIVDSAEWIERLVPHGIKLVQLRMKNVSEEELRAHIQLAKIICQNYDCQLVINDYWKIAIEEKCQFIHLGQEDLVNADVNLIKQSGIKLGISTHDRAELTIAKTLNPDYIALGPIYPTILKKMKWAPQGLEKIKQWKFLIGDIPLVAIGGLTPQRGVEVLESGANSAAVVTDILFNDHPEKRVEEWIKVTEKWR
ncbi:thiamine phosphate synthase [Bartonella tamiae]|uniref:Thiamine-phosphate synthase n=1 Tax=Bartonella tamiae Th239 TaxID=1094558 RepID=J1K0P3_9HYPH|nr:thiamine phosphate synthase [Bartonella tamiae]EJF90605.1 thiamine-phosphate pyrophosphorylase [Bartonella tamiae Th239]EJF94017.1 thiamine-phosphate pyrophosphorylase [Bartonella tamiae Th307]